MAFEVTIANTGATIDCAPSATIAQAAVGTGINYPYACITENFAACITLGRGRK